jgi:D-alanyl-D-alanine carboxypeptidase/D-alanyl-D-alanine-endopeptidase (penicillin-binding protein 4)
VLGESVFTLRVAPGDSPAGGQPRIHTLPEGAAVPTRNLAVVGTGGGLRIRREHPSQPIMVEGALPAGGREVWRQMTVQDPAHFAASVLREVLQQKGLRVAGGVRVVQEGVASAVTGRRLWAPFTGRPAPRVLARHVSPPLREYLSVVNKRSHNLLADQIFRTVGRITLGDGSYQGGAKAVGRFLTTMAGVDSTHLVIHDGSGLSALNRVSAADFVAVTGYMAGVSHWDAFWESLPEAGDPRGLRRMYRTAAQGNLRAKTGTIERVSALSGMVRSVNGERIAFSIISNQVPSTAMAKRLEDRIGTRLASFERPLGEEAPRLAEALPGDDAAEVGANEGGNGGLDAKEAESTVETSGERSAIQSGGDGAPVAEKHHQVRSGENLSVIARRYGLTLRTLLDGNPDLTETDRLQVGQQIRIPPLGGGH